MTRASRATGLDKLRNKVVDWKDERIEGPTRGPGGGLWKQMKDNANDLSSTPHSGVVQLFNEYARLKATKKMPQLRLHLIGHSAGAIVQSYLVGRALRNQFKVDSMSLMAPAVRIDDFDRTAGTQIVNANIRVLVANLLDSAERADSTCKPYGHSLLYLVSRAFEKSQDEVPLLGMEKHLVPAVATHAWGSRITRLASPGVALRPNDKLTGATSHGGMDDDVAVQDAVIRHIKGASWDNPVIRDNSQLRR